jgi:DNA primase
MEREEDILDVLAPRIINEYKLRKIKIMQAEILKEVYKVSGEKLNDLLNTMHNLKKIEKELSGKLGSRTIN